MDKLWKSFYVHTEDNSHILQGDLISTTALNDAFGGKIKRDVYPYFFANYHIAIVVTASCDLAKKTMVHTLIGCSASRSDS